VTAELTQETFEAAASGDGAAFTALYRALSPNVHGYLLAHGVLDPEALTNDVFLAVFGRLPELSGGIAGLRTFVFSVAHARMVDDLRRRQRRPEPLPYLPELDTRSTASAEDAVLASDGSERLLAMINRLNPDHAETLTLRIVADLSVEQTAAVLGRSVGAVKQLQRRALLQLRALLAEEGVTR
jgi:RNA polymerase sigma factor (sigma-70 family)